MGSAAAIMRFLLGIAGGIQATGKRVVLRYELKPHDSICLIQGAEAPCSLRKTKTGVIL